MYTTVEEAYKAGYNDGYTWLTSGWNFIHPYGSYTYPSGRTIKGYIPGGPFAFTASKYNTSEIQLKAKLSQDCNKAWVKGWIDGINSYVLDNNLDYQPVKG